MKPTLLFPFVHSYGLMLAVGFYAAWWLAARRAKAEGVDSEIIGNLVLISILAGIVGSRILWFVLEGQALTSWWQIFEVWKGGLVFYGGLLGAAAADVVYAKWRRLPLAQLADIAAPGVAIGQAFGRLGCFLNGCCYGGLSTVGFPLAVRFPAFLDGQGNPLGSPAFVDHAARSWVLDDAGASLPVHPSELYDSGSLFLVTALLVLATPLRRRYGEVFALVCMLNAASRLATELVRRDAEAVALGLTAGQLGALFVLGLGIVLFGWARLRGAPVPWEAGVTQ